MTSSYEFANNPRQYAEQVLHDSETALHDAVAAVNPENPDANALEVFPAPGEVRAEDPGMQLSIERGEALRAAAAQLGFERPTDAMASSLGLSGAHFIIEGGQPHKIVAEAGLVMDDAGADPTTLIFSASPYRKITSDAEKASCINQFGEVPATEYDVARRAAESLPGFQPTSEDEVLEFGYDIDANFQITNDATGQFVRIGYVNDAPVIMLRIDREEYTDEEGAAKYRKQPGADAVMAIVDAVTAESGDATAPIAFVTSATYQPSRSVDAAKIGLNSGRVIGVATYGTERLADVNGTALPAPRRLDQLPGEMYKLAQEIEKLRAALEE